MKRALAAPTAFLSASCEGSNPMVGYGAGAFPLALLERDGSIAGSRCR